MATPTADRKKTKQGADDEAAEKKPDNERAEGEGKTKGKNASTNAFMNRMMRRASR